MASSVFNVGSVRVAFNRNPFSGLLVVARIVTEISDILLIV